MYSKTNAETVWKVKYRYQVKPIVNPWRSKYYRKMYVNWAWIHRIVHLCTHTCITCSHTHTDTRITFPSEHTHRVTDIERYMCTHTHPSVRSTVLYGHRAIVVVCWTEEWSFFIIRLFHFHIMSQQIIELITVFLDLKHNLRTRVKVNWTVRIYEGLEGRGGLESKMHRQLKMCTYVKKN